MRQFLKKYANPSQRTCISINCLQPADILLTSSRNKGSKLIQELTDGSFSHASLILTQGIIFESIPDGGISQKCIPSNELFKKESGSDWLFVLDDCEVAIVLRHIKYDGISLSEKTELENLLINLVPRYHGLNYPHFSSLISALPNTSALRILGKNLFRLPPSISSRDLDGPFCSYLVALIYEELGKHLFDSELSANSFSPNTFCSSPYLKKVEGAVVYCENDLVRKLQEENEKFVSNDTTTSMMKNLNALARMQMRHALETKKAEKVLTALESELENATNHLRNLTGEMNKNPET